jgi:UPF0716 protein FxsA
MNGVCGVLALLFIGVPALEIYVLIKVGGIVGALPTMGIIIVTGMVGAALAKQQGMAALRKAQSSLMAGQEIGNSLVEGALVLVAAVLMLTPGFITDVVGIGLLLPPIRAVAARRVMAWGAKRVQSNVVIGGFPGHDYRDDDDEPPPGVIDV